MQGKQALRAFFREEDISHIFQLPGLHTLALNAELFCDENIKTITARHETNLAFMADGYARVSGKPAVIVITPGPGLGNIVSGCMEAYSDDVPLFIIHIDTDRKDIGKGILHELKAPEDIFRHFIKASFRVDGPPALRSSLEDALRTCSTGRKGPVLVSIPFGLLDKEIPASDRKTQPPPGEPADSGRTQAFVAGLERILEGKRRPVLLGGKALMNPRAGGLVDEICGRGIPFLTSTGGKGITSDRNPFSFGNMMAKGVSRDILASADVVIAAGTRLRDVDAKRRGVKIDELVHIDVDDRWIGRNYPTVLHCAGDVDGALEGFARIVREKTFSWDIAGLRKRRDSEMGELSTSPGGYALIELLRNAVPEDAIIACDLNMPSYWAEYYLPVYFQRSFIMPRGISPIFYSLAAALGAKTARPDLPCLALCGDGGGLPQMAELATIMKYTIPITIFVHNNNSYSILEDAMQSRHHISGSMELYNPDFVKLARAFGIKARRTRTLRGLREIFSRDVHWDEPFLVEFTDNVSSPPWNQ
ncbi:MAG: thiamine pyrophosphate-binding protein [Syntrophorhabdaceae bacterium]|nr:thiamine pyrophosphate-binding protein [Syntrophorhabdaceae bacterium]